MAEKVRVVSDDYKGLSRRSFFGGSFVVAASLILGVGLPTCAASTYPASQAYAASRTAGLYSIDTARTLRKSHANAEILALYEDFLSPGEVMPAYTELSHRLCHTTFGDKIPAHIEELKSTSISEVKAEAKEQMKELLKKADEATSESAPAENAAASKATDEAATADKA